jgi:hypothetical protein
MAELRQVHFAEWGRSDLLYAWTIEQGGRATSIRVRATRRNAVPALDPLATPAGTLTVGGCR